MKNWSMGMGKDDLVCSSMQGSSALFPRSINSISMTRRPAVSAVEEQSLTR